MTTEVFTLKNAQGAEVQITNFGARVISIKVPDRDDRLGDVVLGFDALTSYQGPNPYFGGIVGRYANRIAKGKFTIGGSEAIRVDLDFVIENAFRTVTGKIEVAVVSQIDHRGFIGRRSKLDRQTIILRERVPRLCDQRTGIPFVSIRAFVG